MPFIIGIHSSLMTEVNKILSHDNDIVVANIDEGTIEASSSQDNEIPSEAVGRKIFVDINISFSFLVNS